MGQGVLTVEKDNSSGTADQVYMDDTSRTLRTSLWVWNGAPGVLAWERMTQPLTDTLARASALPVGLNAYRSSDSTYQPARLDKATNTIQTIEYEHHEIHAGSHFFHCSVQDLSINQVLDFTLATPNTAKWLHMTWRIETEAETAVYVYEGATATNALANAITILNSDRNSATTADGVMKYEVQANLTAANADTNVTEATLLESNIVGAGRTAGRTDRARELILDQNKLYCFRFVATAAGYVNYDFEWYEHTNVA